MKSGGQFVELDFVLVKSETRVFDRTLPIKLLERKLSPKMRTGLGRL